MFQIVDVSGQPERREPIGSKAKFWFRQENVPWLFKEARAGTGEHWAEKVAAELAELLGLPHATVELAQHEGTVGIATRDFTNERERGNLVHGNELLFEVDPGYPKERGYRVQQHTLVAVQRILTASGIRLPEWAWPDGVTTPWDAFLGYLLLDALICNTDRHHQNWGVLVRKSESGDEKKLAPTFDHASSLGRELRDEDRERRLSTKDKRANLSAYVSRARSAFYGVEGDLLGTTEAFERAMATNPGAGAAWHGRLVSITDQACQAIVEQVPDQTMSAPARRFALALLHETRSRLEPLGV